MKHLLVPCCAALLLLAGAGSACADGFEQARAMLGKMADAMGTLAWQGTFVYMRGDDMDTLRITHLLDEHGNVRERLFALSGPEREVIRDEAGVRCALGNKLDALADTGFGRPVFPEIPVQQLGLARNRYLFEVSGSARIAGHTGQRVSILPRDQYRYGYELWLEQESGLLLRWVLYDSDRRVLARLMFTELRIGSDVDAAELESDTPGDQFVRLEEPTASERKKPELLEAVSLPAGLPPGFSLAAKGRGNDAANNPYEHLLLSDGLASVSVYIEDGAAAGSVTAGLSRMGTTNAFSQLQDGRQVTAIGEVPALTVKVISLAYAGGGN